MLLKKYILLLLCCLPLFANAKDYQRSKQNLRGARYCEIILSDGWMKFAVYSTIGLNDCPENKWREITKENVKKETGSLVVILNGPRYWTMDEIKGTSLTNEEVKSFSGLKMKKVAHVKLSLSNLFGGGTPYHPNVVKRDTAFIFDEGKQVYELVSPDGDVYVMQSYTTAKEKLTMKNLVSLDKQLKLPKGWQYKTGVLNKNQKVLSENNKAFVIQDNFMNSYQRASHDFLK